KDLERKKRLHEYRVAARREKRLRKSDEKKQRKLNATILRRMTRNPDKYNKNAERNRMRDIQGERRRIHDAALKQIQQLAALHDPSGNDFNIGPVVEQDDGSIVTAESIRKRQEREAAKAIAGPTSLAHDEVAPGKDQNPIARSESFLSQSKLKKPSKAQQRRQAAFQPYAPPPKPRIPEGIPTPSGEENWLELWDLTDEQIERRILQAKRRKATERKALRIKQQSGKTERREARDEKRKIYRDIKLIWKSIKEDQVIERTRLKAAEDEESKKIAVEINNVERRIALDLCGTLGFTVANTPGAEDIKPRALGMRGKEVDFDAIQAGDRPGNVVSKKRKRVDLGEVAVRAHESLVPVRDDGNAADNEDFIQFAVDRGQDHEVLNYNHKLRRKLRRALDGAQVQKEMLVRQRTLEYLEGNGVAAPVELTTSAKPINVRGVRILENGATETAKQERLRARVELAEFNLASRELRRQAKQCAIEAGLRKHAALTGRLPLKSISANESSLPPHITASAAAVPALIAPPHNKRDAHVDALDDRSGESSLESHDAREGVEKALRASVD
ncbi:MAG: hypothetical protein LQ341_005665, partial [Variospora aurantia]